MEIANATPFGRTYGSANAPGAPSATKELSLVDLVVITALRMLHNDEPYNTVTVKDHHERVVIVNHDSPMYYYRIGPREYMHVPDEQVQQTRAEEKKDTT